MFKTFETFKLKIILTLKGLLPLLFLSYQAQCETIEFTIYAYGGLNTSFDLPLGKANFVSVNGEKIAFTKVYESQSSKEKIVRYTGKLESKFIKFGNNDVRFSMSFRDHNTGIKVPTSDWRKHTLFFNYKNSKNQETGSAIAYLNFNKGEWGKSVNKQVDFELHENFPKIAQELEKQLNDKIEKEAEKEQESLLANLRKAFGKDFAKKVCFTEGTKIKALDAQGKIAYRNLEEIKAGDQVMTCNFEKKACQLRPVKSTLKRDVKKILRISTENETLEVTPEHPFYTPDRGWVEAKRLQVNDKLHSRLEDAVKVSQIEELSGEFWVYNIEVDAPEYAHQNYFVSESDILVHNCHILEGAALVASGAILLGGGAGAGVVIALDAGIAIAKVASGEDLREVAKDVAFNVALQFGLSKLGVNPKAISSAEGRVLEFGKLAKVGRDKILDFTKSLRFTAKKHNFELKKADAERFKNNPLNKTKYTEKVEKQMLNSSDKFHAFPSEVDNFAGLGNKLEIKGGDGVKRTFIQLEGEYNGYKGKFEWIIEPNGTINHRKFEPQ